MRVHRDDVFVFLSFSIWIIEMATFNGFLKFSLHIFKVKTMEQVALQSDLGSYTFVMPTYGLVRKHLFDAKPLIKKD